MGKTVRSIRTGLIFKNPKPHLHSIHAYFPSVAELPGGEMVATFALGEAFESTNLHTHLARSTDGGNTWRHEGPIYPGTGDRTTSDTARITALPDGELVVFMLRADRTGRLEEGLCNPETLGFVPTELLHLRSRDGGQTWSPPEPIAPPLVGPAFEICAPITPLRDGRWLLPTSTWPGWDGDCPNGVRMVAFVSHDRGRTWPAWLNVLHDPAQRVIYWESKVVELSDGRLLAVAWAYDRSAKSDLPNRYALSADGGRTWSPPRSTNLMGQTPTPFAFSGGRVLCVYRRMDRPGLWANVSHLEGDIWVNDEVVPLWGTEAAGLTGTSANMSENFAVLRFGAPCITRQKDGTLFVAFWCYEACVSVIRWFKLQEC